MKHTYHSNQLVQTIALAFLIGLAASCKQNQGQILNEQETEWIPQISINFANDAKQAPKDQTIVFADENLNDDFDKTLWNQECCSSPDFFTYTYDKKEHPFFIVKNNNNPQEGEEFYLASYLISSHFTHGLNPSLVPQDILIKPNQPIRIKPDQTTQLNLNIVCSQPYHYDNYWTALSVNFVFSQTQDLQSNIYQVQAYFMYVCDQKFRPVKYAVSLTLLTLILVVMVFFLAIYSQPMSIKWKENFMRYEIQWYYAWVYAALVALIALLNQIMNKEVLEKSMTVVMGVISGIAAWFFFSELQCHSKTIHSRVSKTLFQINIFSFQIMDIISALFAAALLVTWIVSEKAWWASDFLAICLLGSMMKLLKFKALKQASIFLTICLLVDSIGGFIVYITQALSYDTIFINDYNEPFIIAFPSINVIYDKWCNWLPVSGTAFLGILINLCYRFDKSQKNLNTKAFTYIGSFGYILGSVVYMIITTFNVHTWPYSLINYPIMGLFVFLFAYKRGDHLILWNGSFYDCDSNRQILHLPEDNLEDTRNSPKRLYDGLTLDENNGVTCKSSSEQNLPYELDLQDNLLVNDKSKEPLCASINNISH